MSKRRLKIAAIAASTTGVNADNFIKFCNTIEGWVGIPLDEHPLRLDMPNPVTPTKTLSQRLRYLIENFGVFGSPDCHLILKNSKDEGLECESGATESAFYYLDSALLADETWFIEKAYRYDEDHQRVYLDIPESLASQEPGIDWSRPQLVESKDGNCIVEINDSLSNVVGRGEFCGEMVSGHSYLRTIGKNYTWSRAAFKYLGEIPEEPKTTGLNFLEAMKAVFSGHCVRRPMWTAGAYYYPKDGGVFLSLGSPDNRQYIIKYEVLATDWQILPK